MPRVAEIHNHAHFRESLYAKSAAVMLAGLAAGASIAIPTADAATAPPGVITGAVRSVSPHTAVVAGEVNSHGSPPRGLSSTGRTPH